MTSCYDLVIVGAGISGLRVGIETLKKYPTIRCCILEKYNYNGGRVVTYKKKLPFGTVQWENGAGRISTMHKRVLKLIKKYNLTFVPSSSDTLYDDKTNYFSDLIPIYLAPLKLLSSELQTHTLYELLIKIHGPKKAKEFYEQFPYYSEIHTLRADIGLMVFENEMKSNDNFGTCKEGLSSIIKNMVDEFTKLGGIILHNIELTEISKLNDLSLMLHCIENCSIKQNRTFIAKTSVISLHSEAVKRIKGVKHLPVLNHLTMNPLLRVYAVFNKVWFSDLPKVVTSNKIRYIIPIDYKKGIVMISYTDGKDAMYWMNKQQNTLQDEIMGEIRLMYPNRDIPNPVFFKSHPWYEGCTYWTPGRYNVEDMSNNSLQPLPKQFPSLFMCGESFAVKQCWMESALEQADKLLNLKNYLNSLHN